MQRKLILHIGAHKTGTTSIQATLGDNSELLARNNARFFCEPFKPSFPAWPNFHSWLAYENNETLLPNGMRIRDLDELGRRLAGFEQDVIISSENFSFFFSQKNINLLQECLSAIFSEIVVVCYLRRQDQHIVSHHQEGAKPNRGPEYELFGHSTLAIPPYDSKLDLYLDYEKRLLMWTNAFGSQNMKVKIFDRQTLKDGDAVSDFFQLIGFPDYKKTPDRNISLGYTQTKLGHVVNGGGLANSEAATRFVQERFGTERRSLQPSRAAAESLYRRYVSGNSRLNELLKISDLPTLFGEDFSNYPDTDEDSWSEQDANSVMVVLLEALDCSCMALTIDDLVAAAIAVRPMRPLTALRLLKIAERRRPDGPRIQRELKKTEFLVAELR